MILWSRGVIGRSLMGGVMGGATAGVDDGRTVRTGLILLALVRAASSSCEMTPKVGEYVNHPFGFFRFGILITSSAKYHSHPEPSLRSAHTKPLAWLRSRTMARILLGVVPSKFTKTSTPGYIDMTAVWN